jgi:hypothetical protein
MRSVSFFSPALPVCLALALSGCGVNDTKPPAKGDGKPIIPEPGGPPTAAAHVQRGKQLQRNKNDMGQLATFYIQYELENNRAPASWQDLKTYIGNAAPNLVRLVDSGEVAIVPNVKPASDTVLAYETKPDLNGRQFAAYGDKHVTGLTPQELQQALQNR